MKALYKNKSLYFQFIAFSSNTIQGIITATRSTMEWVRKRRAVMRVILRSIEIQSV